MDKLKKNKKKNNDKGYTMVELLVAMSIFVILITIVMGIFTQGLRSHRSLLGIMSAANNSFLALEQVMRETRVGVDFRVSGGPECPFGFGSKLEFYSYEDGEDMKLISYKLEDGALVKNDTLELTSKRNLTVDHLCFRVVQVGQHNRDICNPWRITVLMQVKSDIWGGDKEIKAQNTVASRILPKEVPFEVSQIYAECRQ